MYSHVGLGLVGDKLCFEPYLVPKASAGRWSRANIVGMSIVLRKLPKVPKTFEFEAPNFGDWGKGSHTIDWTRQVYRRKYVPPKELALFVEVIGEEKEPMPSYAFKFRLEEVLSPASANFEEDLLYGLNILQENVGAADVFPSDSTLNDYLGTLYVEWELLPPGNRDSNITTILKTAPTLSREEKESVVDRYVFFEALRPKSVILGRNGFRRYFGALLAEDLAVFENLAYGNALYVMGENWRETTALSRTELLSKAQHDFVRVRHVGDWKGRTTAIVEKLLPGGR